MSKPETEYVYVQEGGSSDELYVHSRATMVEAVNARKDCAKHTWRTSSIVEVPVSLASHPEFFEVVEALIDASNNVDYPEGAEPS